MLSKGQLSTLKNRTSTSFVDHNPVILCTCPRVLFETTNNICIEMHSVGLRDCGLY